MNTYLSTDFFKQYFPNAKQRTWDSYKVYLKTLNPKTDDVVEWVNDSKSLKESYMKMWLARRISEEFPQNKWKVWEQKFNKDQTILNKEKQKGKVFTQEDDSTRETNNNEIIKNYLASGKINEWSLFGRWLPPRRREIMEIEITDTPKQDINQYSQKTEKFYFFNFKNDQTKSTQVFDWNDLSFMPLKQLTEAKNFLNSRPLGKLFKTTNINYFGNKYKNENGFTINDYRHLWATIGRKTYSRQEYLKLLNWLDHSLSTSVMNYSL